MDTLSDVLKKVDMFGVSMNQEYNKGESRFRTYIGGLITLVIYLLSAAYTFYVLLLYFNKSITPKISDQSYLSDFEMLDLDYSLIKISYWKYGDNVVDPFASNILSAHMFFWAGPLSNETTILEFNKSDLNQGGAIQADPRIKLVLNKDSLGQVTVTSDFYIYFGPCVQSELPEGEQCADSEAVSQFFAQPMNNIQLDLLFKRINPMTGEVQELSQLYYIMFEDQNCQLQNLYFKTKMYEVKNSLLFGTPEIFEFVDDVLAYNQVNTIAYCENIFKQITYATVFISLSNFQTLTSIEFSNIGELLANIGSVVSVLFLSKYAVRIINAYYYEQEILNQLIAYYYPEYKDLNVQYGWRNKVLSVQQGDRQLDPQDFVRFRDKANQIMKTKMSLGNVLYEMSRMLFLMRALFPREKLYKIHRIGVKLRINSLGSQSFELQPDSNECLDDEDCDLLSIHQREISRTFDVNSSTDYFDLNRIDINLL